MRRLTIGAIIIAVIIITNIVTCVTSISATSYYIDYKWGEYSMEQKLDNTKQIFSDIHRNCMKSLDDNNTCNLITKAIYRQHQQHYKPLPGFDYDFITAPIGSVANDN